MPLDSPLKMLRQHTIRRIPESMRGPTVQQTVEFTITILQAFVSMGFLFGANSLGPVRRSTIYVFRLIFKVVTCSCVPVILSEGIGADTAAIHNLCFILKITL